MKSVSATEYEKNALKLLEEVHAKGITVRITKRGKPYARLEPEIGPYAGIVFGGFAGTVLLRGDIVGPIIQESDWEGHIMV